MKKLHTTECAQIVENFLLFRFFKMNFFYCYERYTCVHGVCGEYCVFGLGERAGAGRERKVDETTGRRLQGTHGNVGRSTMEECF